MFRCMGCMAEKPNALGACPFCGYVQGTPAREAYHLEPGTVLKGRYIVGKVLGYGGFGVTHIGYDAALERIVAIKEFLPSTFATRIPGDTAVTVYEGNTAAQFDAGLRRFVEEAQTLAQFNGIPGIVDIYDSFSGNNTAYIVMQFLKGQDVKEILNTNGPMVYERARDIILRVCDTLTPVHARGIIHRDISPDNIFLTDDGEVKLLDFGAARYESAMNSKSLSVILKSGYAPEEQYRSRGEQGPWTDVYALAATFYKMLTGQTPDDSMERAIKDELKEPSKLGAQLTESAQNAIWNALCVRKADRTKTVADFKNALLCDGVERVKVKHISASALRVPLGAKITLASSAVVLVLLGIFAASGGFAGENVIVGGTKLQDEYGSVAKEGFSAVPTITGMTAGQAKQALEAVGLVYKADKYEVSSKQVQESMVTEQEPSAGRQLEEGSTVKVTVDVGEWLGAMEQGLVPQIKGMPANEAIGFTHNTSFRDTWVNYVFCYSDEADIGKVQSIEVKKETDGREYYQISIGSGPDNAARPVGSLRGAILQYGDNIRYSIASGAKFEESEMQDYQSGIEHLLHVSIDGGRSWSELKGNRRTYYGYENYGEDSASIPIQLSENIKNHLIFYFPEMAGKDISLKLERRYMDGRGSIDSLVLPQTYQFNFAGAPLNVESIEEAPYEEVKALYDEGYFDEHAYEITNYLEQNKDDAMRWNVCWRIKGDFTTQQSHYQILWEENETTFRTAYARCMKNGELLIITSRWVFEEGEVDFYIDGGTRNQEVDKRGNSQQTKAPLTKVRAPRLLNEEDKRTKDMMGLA